MTSDSGFGPAYESMLGLAVYLAYDGDPYDAGYLSWCVDESIDEVADGNPGCVDAVIDHYGSDDAMDMLREDLESDVMDEVERNGGAVL